MRKPNGFERLHALIRPQQRIADALNLSKEQVSRIARGRSPVPKYMEALAEFLERVPPEDWPERWR
jgi:transcriptional regulator with XRE-family HTH domain